MKRNKSAIITIIIIVIVISNTPPAAFFLQEHYTYQTKNGKFSFMEEPGKAIDYEVLQIRYKRYLEENNVEDKILYRTFTIKPWRFWEWYQMLFNNQRFRLPYLEQH